MSPPDNPYTPPRAEMPPLAVPWFVSGGRLFVSNGTRLPRFCVITGEPVEKRDPGDLQQFRRGSAWTSAAGYLWLLPLLLTLGTLEVQKYDVIWGKPVISWLLDHSSRILMVFVGLIGLSLFLQAKTWSIRYFLSEELRKKKRRWDSLRTPLWVALAVLGFLIMWANEWTTGYLLMILLPQYFASFLAGRFSPVGRIRLGARSGDHAELVGCGEEFLARLAKGTSPPPEASDIP